MKLAIWNCFAQKPVAETELTRRLCHAARSLGWIGEEVSNSKAVAELQPDLILALHFQTPKITSFPTYGCLWNPPRFFGTYESLKGKRGETLPAIASYDLFLYGSEKIRTWLMEQLPQKVAAMPLPMFYPSCNRSLYDPSDLTRTQLTYIGVNWDRRRYRLLFTELDRQQNTAFYGPAKAWNFIRHSYAGSLPFDGTSVLEALHHHGVGLCLHRPEHTEFAVPSMRIFEIIAAGAVAICGEHEFIRQWFGDAVLYVNPDQDGKTLAKEIGDRLDWIRSHRQQAREMVATTQAIFHQQLCLEQLLTNFMPEHQHLLMHKFFLPAPILQRPPLVTVLLSHCTPEAESLIEQSLTHQTDQRFHVVKGRDLKTAIAQCATPYVTILSGPVELFPNHMALHIAYLGQHPDAAIVCSDLNDGNGTSALPRLQTYLMGTTTLQEVLSTLPQEMPLTPAQVLGAIARHPNLHHTYDLTATFHGTIEHPTPLRAPLLLPYPIKRNWLRELYLWLSGGGERNPNPGAIARLLIALRYYLGDKNIT
jgi:hypothetical protein